MKKIILSVFSVLAMGTVVFLSSAAIVSAMEETSVMRFKEPQEEAKQPKKVEDEQKTGVSEEKKGEATKSDKANTQTPESQSKLPPGRARWLFSRTSSADRLLFQFDAL